MRKISRLKGFRIIILSMIMTNQNHRIVYLIPGPLNKHTFVQDSGSLELFEGVCELFSAPSHYTMQGHRMLRDIHIYRTFN